MRRTGLGRRGRLGFRHTPTRRESVGVELRQGPRRASPAAAGSRAGLQHRLAEAALPPPRL